MKQRYGWVARICVLSAWASVGRAQWASETGFAVVQQQWMKCHGKQSVPQAPGVAALRELTGERVYEVLSTSGSHKNLSLTDDDKRHVAESLSGRLLASAIGDAKSMPNRCALNPSLADPAAFAGWNGWGGDLTNARCQPAVGRRHGERTGASAQVQMGSRQEWSLWDPDTASGRG